MQPKKLLIIIVALMFAVEANAQSENPYKDIGKQGKVLTLTKGEYDESFDEDSIQRIGSAMVNIHTMEVVKVHLTKEELRQWNNAQASKFLSVDPLAVSYPWYTPYQYAGNKPIIAVDMDGLEEKIVTYNTGSDGKVVTTVMDGKNLLYATQASGSYAMYHSITKEQWMEYKKAIWGGFSGLKNDFSGGYEEYTSGMGGRTNTEFTGRNSGTLTIGSGSESTVLVYDPKPVMSNSVGLGESLADGAHAFNTFFFNPDKLVEGSAQFKETVDRVLDVTGLIIGLGELGEAKKTIDVLKGSANLLSSIDDLTKFSENKINNKGFKALVQNLKMALNFVNLNDAKTVLKSAKKNIEDKLPKAIGSVTDLKSLTESLKQDLDMMKENENEPKN